MPQQRFAKRPCMGLLFIWLLAACSVQLPAEATPALSTAADTTAAQPSLPSGTLPAMTPALPAPVPTLDFVNAAPSPEEIIAYITTTVPARVHSTHPSPDELWQAEVAIYDCTQVGVDTSGYTFVHAYEQLTLTRLADQQQEIVASQFLNCGGLGAAGLAGLEWSSNSRFFYFTDARDGVPDGCGYWERPIHRVEAQNLSVERLGGGPLSPDGTRYATWQEQEIVVWDVDQGTAQRWPAAIPDAHAGPIAWSPDNESLVYLQFDLGCPLSGKSYLIQLDLATGEQAHLLASEAPTFGYVAWEEMEQLILSDMNSVQWVYKLATATLEQAAASE